mmetsp:Transcript_2429/g.3726  ORF Transcript_2429/g.3726 Transcript_2429/m.3726 type:complete len:101 (+) Transcript_2429:2379-2681(+)
MSKMRSLEHFDLIYVWTVVLAVLDLWAGPDLAFPPDAGFAVPVPDLPDPAEFLDVSFFHFVFCCEVELAELVPQSGLNPSEPTFWEKLNWTSTMLILVTP